jgi:hypothetical protein
MELESDLVPKFRQSVARLAHVVIAHHAERADHLALADRPCRGNETISDQVTDRLGAVCAASLDDK